MKYFGSEIEGKKINDFQKYDSTIKKYEDRLSMVEELINDEDDSLHTFFPTYFEQYYNSTPSQNGYLSEEDAVCRTIEGLGTYLLNSKDIQSNRKIEYRFWKSKREYNNYKESKNVNESSIDTGEDSNVDVIDMFYTNDDKNHLKSKTIEVGKRDVLEIAEIKDLQNIVDLSKNKAFIKSIEDKIDEALPYIEDEKDASRLKTIRRNVEKFMRSWASSAKDNQIIIKESVKKPFDFNGGTRLQETHDKLEYVDFYDEKSVKELLKELGREENLVSDMGIMMYDFNNLLDEITFTASEYDIIEAFRMGYSQKKLPEKFGISKQAVGNRIKRICEKVTKHYVKMLYKTSIKNK